jgi:hypothetical protein
MAQVAAPRDVSVRIDDYLTYLTNVMDDLIEIDAEWDSLDDIEQLDFIFEWDIKRDRLDQLGDWDRQGLLSSAQRQRYWNLQKVLEQRRPILNRLLAE